MYSFIYFILYLILFVILSFFFAIILCSVFFKHLTKFINNHSFVVLPKNNKKFRFIVFDKLYFDIDEKKDL